MITNFRGQYSFLSNFYSAEIRYEGLDFSSVEVAFQAMKTLDSNIRQQFSYLNSPEAKKRGRKIPLRSDWNKVKLQIMLDLVRIKFNNNKHLRALLLATKEEVLIEENTWGDTYWGVCNGNGNNYLGRILMQVREEL